MLRLSEAYPKRVGLGAKVTFVSNEDHAKIDSLDADLVLNIDSFQEMPRAVISLYMDHIAKRAKRFYCKNSTGKYLPKTIGQPDLSAAKLMEVFKLGYCQDVIDIFDDIALHAA